MAPPSHPTCQLRSQPTSLPPNLTDNHLLMIVIQQTSRPTSLYDLLADKTTDQPSDQSADKPMLILPDSSDESEGAIVEAIRRALRKKKARKMEEAEGLLAREMRGGEVEVQTHAGARGQSNEHINTPPSNELSNAPSSNVHINASLRKKPSIHHHPKDDCCPHLRRRTPPTTIRPPDGGTKTATLSGTGKVGVRAPAREEHCAQ